MDLHQKRYFFLSGLISLTFFIGLLLLVGYSLIFSPNVVQFAMLKSDVINVSIAISKTKVTKQTNPELAITPRELKPIEKQEKVSKPVPVPDISDLFANVKPQKIVKKTTEERKENEQLNKLEKELLAPKDNPKFTDKVNKIEFAKPSVKMIAQGGSTGPIVNEYHAKIQGLVYTYFRPPAGTAGDVARVRMTISATGKLISYKVITYSGNGLFNSEVDWLKDRLSSIHFPVHPEGKDAILEFILTAKE
jgi:periplasmic protein TonB